MERPVNVDVPGGMLYGFEQWTAISSGSVEKSRQRRSRHFFVLTYREYAPRVKKAVALLDGLF